MPTVGTGKKKRTFKYTKAGKMKAAKYAKKTGSRAKKKTKSA